MTPRPHAMVGTDEDARKEGVRALPGSRPPASRQGASNVCGAFEELLLMYSPSLMASAPQQIDVVVR